MAGRALIVLGLLLIAAGALLILGEKHSWLRIGRLPGDIVIKGRNSVFYFPLMTSLLASLLLTLVLWAIRRFK